MYDTIDNVFTITNITRWKCQDNTAEPIVEFVEFNSEFAFPLESKETKEDFKKKIAEAVEQTCFMGNSS